MRPNPYASPTSTNATATTDPNRVRLQVLRWMAGAEFLFFLFPALMFALVCLTARRSPLAVLSRERLPVGVMGVYSFRILVSYITQSAAGRALASGSRRAAWTTALLASVPYLSP